MKDTFFTLTVALAGLMGLAVAGKAQSVQPIYSFSAPVSNGSGGYTNADGASPNAALTLGLDGNFYGTTRAGGRNGYGTVFRVTTNGVLTTLVSFASTNGAYPHASLTLGPDGNFYGITWYGGSNYFGGNSGYGTVFQVTTNGVLTALHSFTAVIAGGGAYTNSDGANPYGGLALGPDGNFYGTSVNGGSRGFGTVFQVTTNGTLTTLVNFDYWSTNGANPKGTLALGPDGNFYGTTEYGGGGGVVFQVTTSGVLTTLANFDNSNGEEPYAGLTPGPDGNFYGTTRYGGRSLSGTVFQVTTNGALNSLVSFDSTNGEQPFASLTLGPGGNFYGTTYQGSSNGNGTVFQVTTNGVLTTLYSFTITAPSFPPNLYYTNSDGANPFASLTLGPDGNFYGTTSAGGRHGNGVIYRLNLSPTISQIIPNADSSVTLNLVSLTNDSSRLYAATNLLWPVVWQPITTNLSGGVWQFTDTNTAGSPAKFYRMSTP